MNFTINRSFISRIIAHFVIIISNSYQLLGKLFHLTLIFNTSVLVSEPNFMQLFLKFFNLSLEVIDHLVTLGGTVSSENFRRRKNTFAWRGCIVMNFIEICSHSINFFLKIINHFLVIFFIVLFLLEHDEELL